MNLQANFIFFIFFTPDELENPSTGEYSECALTLTDCVNLKKYVLPDLYATLWHAQNRPNKCNSQSRTGYVKLSFGIKKLF